MGLPCSKELYPLGFRRDERTGDLHTEVVSRQLLDKFHRAGVTRAYIVLRDGKWDIPAYYRDGGSVGLDLAYIVITDSLGPPDTLDRAYPFVRNDMIAFGFPDIVFGPDDAFERLASELRTTGADIVLGLYPTTEPSSMDMVDVDQTGRVRSMVLKPETTTLTFTWACAVWQPSFTDFMHASMKEARDNYASSRSSLQAIDAGGDIPIGAIVKRAVDAQLRVHAVTFPDHTCLDIGTPRNLAEAVLTLLPPETPLQSQQSSPVGGRSRNETREAGVEHGETAKA
jgi:glucose-1-phosphate thymidylyltransferase